MYGYQDVGGHCISCLTWDEALELALTYSEVGGFRYKIQGELLQHYGRENLAKYRVYCWTVSGLGEQSIGDQRLIRTARSNGRADRSLT